MKFTLSRILSGLANFSTERSETFRITSHCDCLCICKDMIVS